MVETPFGRWLRNKREESGLSRAELASAVGTSEQIVESWEEKGESPDLWALPAIMRRFSVSPEKFLSIVSDGKHVDPYSIKGLSRRLSDGCGGVTGIRLLAKDVMERAEGNGSSESHEGFMLTYAALLDAVGCGKMDGRGFIHALHFAESAMEIWQGSDECVSRLAKSAWKAWENLSSWELKTSSISKAVEALMPIAEWECAHIPVKDEGPAEIPDKQTDEYGSEIDTEAEMDADVETIVPEEDKEKKEEVIRKPEDICQAAKSMDNGKKCTDNPLEGNHIKDAAWQLGDNMLRECRNLMDEVRDRGTNAFAVGVVAGDIFLSKSKDGQDGMTFTLKTPNAETILVFTENELPTSFHKGDAVAVCGKPGKVFATADVECAKCGSFHQDILTGAILVSEKDHIVLLKDASGDGERDAETLLAEAVKRMVGKSISIAWARGIIADQPQMKKGEENHCIYRVRVDDETFWVHACGASADQRMQEIRPGMEVLVRGSLRFSSVTRRIPCPSCGKKVETKVDTIDLDESCMKILSTPESMPNRESSVSPMDTEGHKTDSTVEPAVTNNIKENDSQNDSQNDREGAVTPYAPVSETESMDPSASSISDIEQDPASVPVQESLAEPNENLPEKSPNLPDTSQESADAFDSAENSVAGNNQGGFVIKEEPGKNTEDTENTEDIEKKYRRLIRENGAYLSLLGRMANSVKPSSNISVVEAPADENGEGKCRVAVIGDGILCDATKNDVVSIHGPLVSKKTETDGVCKKCGTSIPCNGDLASVHPSADGAKVVRTYNAQSWSDTYIRKHGGENIAGIYGQAIMQPFGSGAGDSAKAHVKVRTACGEFWIHAKGKVAETIMDSMITQGTWMMAGGKLETETHTLTTKCFGCGEDCVTHNYSVFIVPEWISFDLTGDSDRNRNDGICDSQPEPVDTADTSHASTAVFSQVSEKTEDDGVDGELVSAMAW